MHNVPTNAPIRTYILDLVYLSAALQGAGFDDLAARTQTTIAALKHQRAEYERAEELEVVATAAVSARDYQLDTSVTAAAALLKAHHPALFETVFPQSPSAVARQAYDDEVRSVRAAVAHLATLPAADPVRTAFADRLDAHAFVENQLLDGNIINGAPTARYNRSGFGLGLDWKPLPDNNKLTVSPGITWTFTDRNSTLGGQNNDQFIGTLRTTFSF